MPPSGIYQVRRSAQVAAPHHPLAPPSRIFRRVVGSLLASPMPAMLRSRTMYGFCGKHPGSSSLPPGRCVHACPWPVSRAAGTRVCRAGEAAGPGRPRSGHLNHMGARPASLLRRPEIVLALPGGRGRSPRGSDRGDCLEWIKWENCQSPSPSRIIYQTSPSSELFRSRAAPRDVLIESRDFCGLCSKIS